MIDPAAFPAVFLISRGMKPFRAESKERDSSGPPIPVRHIIRHGRRTVAVRVPQPLPGSAALCVLLMPHGVTAAAAMPVTYSRKHAEREGTLSFFDGGESETRGAHITPASQPHGGTRLPPRWCLLREHASVIGRTISPRMASPDRRAVLPVMSPDKPDPAASAGSYSGKQHYRRRVCGGVAERHAIGSRSKGTAFVRAGARPKTCGSDARHK